MLVFTTRSGGPFEIFARAQSKSYFDRIKSMFAANGVESLKPVLDVHKSGERAPRYDFHRISIASLMGADKLATRD